MNWAFSITLGADEANRTPDLLITNQLLYQLSYISEGTYSSKKSAYAQILRSKYKRSGKNLRAVIRRDALDLILRPQENRHALV